MFSIILIFFFLASDIDDPAFQMEDQPNADLRREIEELLEHHFTNQNEDVIIKQLESVSKHGTILEIGVGQVAHAFAKKTDITIVSIMPERFITAYKWMIKDLDVNSTPYVCSSSDITKAIHSLTSNPQVCKEEAQL